MSKVLEGYVPVEALADHLSVKASTIRQWVQRGLIPPTTYIRVANTYRFNILAVVDALQDNKPEEDEGEFGLPPEQLELDLKPTETTDDF